MPRTEPTPLMRQACQHAKAVLITAIEDVYDALGETGCALEYPAVLAGYMQVAAGAYQLTIRDAIDAFIEAQEARGAQRTTTIQ
jgi:hypothetical protein